MPCGPRPLHDGTSRHLVPQARDHGISSVGLPSRLAAFRAVPLPPLGGSRRGGSRQQQQDMSEEWQRSKGRQPTPTWWDRHVPCLRQRGCQPGPPAGGGMAGVGAGADKVAQQRRQQGETLAMQLSNVEPRGRPALPALPALLGRGGGGVRGGPARARGLASPICTIEMPRLRSGRLPQQRNPLSSNVPRALATSPLVHVCAHLSGLPALT